MTDSPTRPALEAALAQLTEQALSRGEVAGHVALTLFAAAMAVLLGLLLTTEPGIPMRTNIAFWAMLAIAISWVAYGLRVLSRRRPLLANREVVAGRMALLFSAAFTVSTMAVGWVNAGIFITPATWLGATMVAVAVGNLARAMWRRSRLQSLRERLERELAAR
ncbi:MAG: hypothetical protein A3E01_06640 [Gammaproteobacteria bacterium RIFCSPHIGHO2_12_FULL_63_22]|nr:MAG: hypothetical protein A3E01_06640 [Gammaproteobacteria bacterium RIFCSPHIGHO2_12_FULL_63_22]